MLRQPRQSVCYHLSPSALHRLVAVLLVEIFRVEISVVGVKTTIKTRSAPRRIESQRTDKCRRVISVGAQDIGGKRQVLCQRHGKIEDLVKLRIGAGENRRV